MKTYTMIAYSTGAAIGGCAGVLWPLLGGAMIWAGYGAWAWSAYLLMPVLGAVIGGLALALLVNILVETTKLIIKGGCALISYLWGIEFEAPTYVTDPTSEYHGGLLDVDWSAVGTSLSEGGEYLYEGVADGWHQMTTYFSETCHTLRERVCGRTYPYNTTQDRMKNEGTQPPSPPKSRVT